LSLLSRPRAVGRATGTGAESRLLRDRQVDIQSRLDRSTVAAFRTTPRRLVQVYDAGKIPAAGDHFFACYPVELDGIETEGSPGTPVPDTTTTLFVDVLGGPASVGDLLTAYAVGGRWVAERGAAPPGCTATVCVLDCAKKPIAVSGATVKILYNSFQLDSQTTGPSGCVVVCLGPPTNYDVKVTAAGYPATTRSIFLTSGIKIAYGLNSCLQPAEGTDGFAARATVT
jgi:hypothetical protein